MSREISEFQRDIGQRIKAVRMNAGMSQPDFAERLGFSQPTISRIEAGTRMPDAFMLKAIIENFGCDPALLLLGREGKNS